MQFTLNKSIEILERTPDVISTLISGLSNDWTMVNEGPGTWSVVDIIGHLVYIEKANWLPRAQIILSDKDNKLFEILDPSGHVGECREKNMEELLAEFRSLRILSLRTLNNFQIGEEDLVKTAGHPVLGTVDLSQLLSTWVVHDLSHIAQVARVMAHQYKEAVGPFSEFLSILKK